MMEKYELTREQERVFSFISRYRNETGFPPTVREIANALGYRSPNNVRQHLRLIEQKGFIRLLPGKARGIEIVASTIKDHVENEFGYDVPLIGSVAAGKPITAIENIDGYITLDKSIFRGEGLFALRIRGDSMIGIGILNGDIVVIRRKSTAENGEVVVVIIDGDATLKRFVREKDRVYLRAENPAYSDIELFSSNSIQIAGKLVGVIRKY
jgi:repressor LexA